MRTKWNNLPLHVRLTVIYVGLLAVLLAALGAVFHFDVRQLLINNIAVRLRAQSKPIIENYAFSPNGDVESELKRIAGPLSQSLTSRDTAAIIIDLNGEILASGKRLAEEPPAVAPDKEFLNRALAGATELTQIIETERGRQLVVLIPLRRSLGSAEIVGAAQLNSPLATIDQTLTSQIFLIALGIFLTLAVGIIGGIFLTAQVLSPLREMARTCRAIAAGDLSRRVALPPARRDEIGQLAESFDEMVSRLERSFAAERRFIADASHELKTPLAALQGSLEVLMRGAQDDPATAQRLTQGMHRETLRLKRLVEKLLNLSRLDSAPALHLEKIEVESFLHEFVEQARMLATNRLVEVVEAEPAVIAADADTLKQMLFNLVENAARHTGEDGEITLGWQRNADEVEIFVADNGEGIAETDLPHIFEPFYRGTNDRSRSRLRGGGAGLGLSLVQTAIHAHGGKIVVYSSRTKGSRFALLFPTIK